MLLVKELSHFDPPQTIKYTHVHEHQFLMLQTLKKNEREAQARELAYI